MTRALQHRNKSDSARTVSVFGLAGQAATCPAEQINGEELGNSGGPFRRALPASPLRDAEPDGVESRVAKDGLSVACFEDTLSSLKEITLTIFLRSTQGVGELVAGSTSLATHLPGDTYRRLRDLLQTALRELDDGLPPNRLATADESEPPVSSPEEKICGAGGVNGLPIRADERAWLGRLEQVVTAQMEQPDLTAAALADELAMTRRTFYRTLKRLTGGTPAQYVTEARFAQARLLLENGQVSSVKQAAYRVGFRQVSHFARAYQQRFGKNPASYRLR